MKKIFIIVFILMGMSAAGFCAEKSRLELADGSVLEGEIVSLENGVYTVNSGSLGKMRIEASKIQKIESSGMANAANTISSDTDLKSKMDRLTEQMTGNPEIMKIVTGLLTNPEFQEMAKDPEIAAAASRGDIQALTSNKKFMSLVEDPDIKAIKSKIKE